MQEATNAKPEQDRIIELEKNVSAAKQSGDSTSILKALVELGQAYLGAGDAPKALTQFEQGAKLAHKRNVTEQEAQFLGFTGIALKQIGNYDFALRQFRKSNKLAVQLDHKTLACDSHIQIAMLLSRKGEETKAVSQLSQAMKIATDARDPSRKMRVSSLLADNFFKLDALDKSVEYYVLAQEAARDLNNKQAEVSFLTSIANIFLYEGEIDSAIGQYERALKMAEPLENANTEMNILGGLFRAYAQQGNIELAQSYGDKAIHLAQTIKHVEAEIANLHAMANVLIEGEQFKQGLVYIEKGLALCVEHGSDDWLLVFQSSLGFAMYQINDLDEALKHYESALVLAEEMQNSSAESAILAKVSAIQADQGKYEESIVTAQRAMTLATGQNNRGLVGELQSLMAFAYQDLEQVEVAVKFFEDAIVTYKSLQDTTKIAVLSECRDALSM